MGTKILTLYKAEYINIIFHSLMFSDQHIVSFNLIYDSFPENFRQLEYTNNILRDDVQDTTSLITGQINDDILLSSQSNRIWLDYKMKHQLKFS